MLKGMNTEASGQHVATLSTPAFGKSHAEVYGEGHPFGDPSWYQAYNTPYYKDSHKQFRKLMREPLGPRQSISFA